MVVHKPFKGLGKNNNTEIGLQFQILLGSPDLKIGTTLHSFNSLGNIPSSIDLLMIYVKGFI